jgi:molecular chaperone HtpG
MVITIRCHIPERQWKPPPKSACFLCRWSKLETDPMAKQEFQTEVNQLLHLIIHSLYSHKEIFLRELVSNASDALDKLKYLNLTEEPYKSLPFDPRIDLDLDEEARTLTISDNGIGMNEEDLISHLGTIARSGTKNFLSQLSGDAKRDSNLIGQFGVGFYSVFMVADHVQVISRKAAEEKAWRWTSDGKSGYEIEPAERAQQGTTVTVYFNDEGKEFANGWKLKEIVKKYSNHIAFPIYLTADKSEWDEEAKKSVKKRNTEQINSASALWKRPKSELKDEDYKELYKTISGDWEDPMFWFHTKAEGTMEYTTLFFIPAKAPVDLYQAGYKPGVKLYVKRVFITDEAKDLLPPYLRFVRGIIDSEDLPLNVSREILQQNRVLSAIKTASVKKILAELKSIADKEPEAYLKFIAEFNRPIKEGVYSDFANRDSLLDLIRVKSTKAEGWTSFAEVKSRMKEGQKGIYFITGGTFDLLRTSPLLEIYKKKDIEVLILDDEIDEFVFSGVDKYQDIELKAINKASASEDLKDEADQDKSDSLKPLLEKIKSILGDNVKDVKASIRLADSPSCIVSDEDEPSLKMQQMLKAMGQQQLPTLKPTLEINPDHAIVKKLLGSPDEDLLNDAAWLLFDQALLVEGLPVQNPGAFVQRLNRVLNRAV